METIKTLNFYNVQLAKGYPKITINLNFDQETTNFLVIADQNFETENPKAALSNHLLSLFFKKPSRPGNIIINNMPWQNLYFNNYNLIVFSDFKKHWIDYAHKANFNLQKILTKYIKKITNIEYIIKRIKEENKFNYYYLLWKTNEAFKTEDEKIKFKSFFQKVFFDNLLKEQEVYGQRGLFFLHKYYFKSLKSTIQKIDSTSEWLKDLQDQYQKYKKIVFAEKISNYKNQEFKANLKLLNEITFKNIYEKKQFRKCFKSFIKEKEQSLKYQIKSVNEKLKIYQDSFISQNSLINHWIKDLVDNQELQKRLSKFPPNLTNEELLEIFVKLINKMPFNIVFLDHFFDLQKVNKKVRETLLKHEKKRLIIQKAKSAKNIISLNSQLLILEKESIKHFAEVFSSDPKDHPLRIKFNEEIKQLNLKK